MSQLSFTSFDSSHSLMVRDARGRYALATAQQILDAARVVVDQQMQRGTSLTSLEVVKAFLRAKLSGLEHEVFSVLFLDLQNRLIEYVEMFRGTIDCASVYPREVVKAALKCNAAAVMIAHCHPSGNTEPSAADLEVTRQLKNALAMVDVRTLDHIIVAGNATTSFSERGLL